MPRHKRSNAEKLVDDFEKAVRTEAFMGAERDPLDHPAIERALERARSKLLEALEGKC